MKLADRILTTLYDRAVKANRAIGATFDSSAAFSTTSPHYTDYKSYLQAYKLPWVRACVQVIAYNCANIEYRLVRGDLDDDDENRIVAQSPLLDLLARPNPQQSGFQFIEKAVTHLELTGNTFWSFEELNGQRQPAEMYLLRPDLVAVIPDRTELIAGYRYSANGKTIRYEPDEILQLTYVNPLDDLYGMGVIEAGEARFDSERLMNEHERQFWGNGAKITGVFTTDETIDDNSFKRMVSQMKTMFRGKGYVTPILEKGLKYQPVSDGPAKLGLLELSKASRDTILAMFGVPPTKLGILENANYKAQNADEFFWTETIDPKLTRIEQALQPLVDRFHPGEGLHIEFDRLNFTDDLPVATVAQAMRASESRTINEIRTYQGLDPVDGGDVILIPNTTTTFDPTTGEIAAPAAPLPGEMKRAQIVDGKATLKLLKSPQRPATAAVVAKRRDRMMDRAKHVHAPTMRDFFAGQRERVVTALAPYKRRKAALSTDAVWNGDDEHAKLAAALKGIHEDAMKSGYDTANRVGVNVSFDLANPLLADFQGTLATRVTGINDTTKTAIDSQINEGLRRGYSVTQIAAGVPDEGYKGVGGVFDEAQGYRAETIARTESMNAYNGAATIAYKQSGVVSQCELLDGTDDDDCAARNGLVVDLDEVDDYLADEHPNGTLVAIPMVGDAA